MDTRFSVAVHSLILIAKSDIPLRLQLAQE